MVTTFSTVSSWLSILSCTITLCPLQESIKTKISKTIYQDHCLFSSLFISYQRNNYPKANFCLTRKSTCKRTVLQEIEFEDKRKACLKKHFYICIKIWLVWHCSATKEKPWNHSSCTISQRKFILNYVSWKESNNKHLLEHHWTDIRLHVVQTLELQTSSRRPLPIVKASTFTCVTTTYSTTPQEIGILHNRSRAT